MSVYDHIVERLETIKNTKNKRERDTVKWELENNYAKETVDYICQESKRKLNLDNDGVDCDYAIYPTEESFNFEGHQFPTPRRQLSEMIEPFLYYGYFPGYLSGEQLDDQGFYNWYFLWQKYDDPNRFPIPLDLVISDSNFSQHRYWNKEQLNAYYFANILPKILVKCDVKLNINNDVYKKDLEIDTRLLKVCVAEYIESKNTCMTEAMIDYVKSFVPSDDEALKHEFWFSPFRGVHRDIVKSLIQVKYTQSKVQESLYSKLQNIVERSSKKRFKWENLCSIGKLGDLSLDELQELAILEKIPYYLMLTKRELCAEFAKRFENVIQGKSKIEPKCINTTSILGTELSEIPPEFFFSYIHNNKVYCDDIRDLHKHFEINGNKHPIDRSVMKQSVVDNINKWYNYLVSITNTMTDFEEEEAQLPLQSQLTSRMALLSSKMNYPNSSDLFINSDTDKLDMFIESLISENILTKREKDNLSQYELQQRKMVLIDMLLLKIKNDPQQVQVGTQILSAIAINLSNIYNETFN